MKIWMRYLAGTILGVILGVVLPLSGGDTYTLLRELTTLVVRVGRFFLFPMVFFAAIVAVDELREDQALVSTSVLTTAVTIGTVFVASLLGALSVVALQPQRIPPMVQEGRAGAAPDLLEQLRAAVPGNSFRVFVADDNALFMILLLGVLIGLTLRFDRGITSPVSLVADSANRILYRLNGILVGVVGVGLVVPAAMVAVWTRQAQDLALFAQFLLVVGTGAFVTGAVIYPAVLYLVDREHARPLTWIYRMLPASLAAIVSGDVYFSLATYSRVANDNLGISRRVGGSVPPLVAIFGRAGTALVSVAAFLLVIRSYTALEIGFAAVVQLVLTGVLYVFVLGRTPIGGVTLLLSYIAVRYGRGMEESYLILLPVMPLLERIGAWLDMMTVGFVTQLVARRHGAIRRVERTV